MQINEQVAWNGNNTFFEQFLQPRWKDITSLLDKATQDFKVGQLLHLPSFSLLDAMNAIEIMDPRMDTGMILEGNVNKTFDMNNRLAPKQIMYVMDHLITLEMAWIAGHPLPQTVFTCIYLHHLKDLGDTPMPTIESDVESVLCGVFKSYVLSTARCCHFVHAEMLNRNIFEQEDFTSNLYGLSLNDQRPNELILNDMSASVFLIRYLMKGEKYDITILEQILYRVEMRHSYLMSLIYLSQNDLSYLHHARTELRRTVQALQQIDLDCSERFSDAFDPHINRKSTTQGPPRVVKLASESDALKDFQLLIERLISICDVPGHCSTKSLMTFFDYFGAQQPYVDAFSRSKLNTVFYGQANRRIFGTIPVPQMISTSIKETVQPPAWWLVPNVMYAPSTLNPSQFYKAHERLNTWYDKTAMFFIEYVRIHLHNRPRQRRLLFKLLPHWERLQNEAARVDELFHQLYLEGDKLPYYFSSWVYSFKLNMMEEILCLGFELDLYGENEYIMIFWYLQNVMVARTFLLDRITSFIDRAVDTTSVLEFLYSKQLLNQAKKNLSEAILRILITAKHSNQFDLRATVFDDEATRYKHRFGRFAHVRSPTHPTYETYLEKMHIDHFNAEYMIQMALQNLDKSKLMLEKLVIMTAKETSTQLCHALFVKEVTHLLHVAVLNRNQVKHIPGNTAIRIEFKYHAWCPTITLQ